MTKARNGLIKNVPYLCLIGVIALGLMTIVGSNGSDVDEGGAAGDETSEISYEDFPIADSEAINSGSEDSNYFYFSYDDSASTVAVELAKYQLNHDILPSSTLARPWEYLNYESFDPSSPESIGLFTVSMGLMKRSSFDDQNISEYHLGVYIQSPGITKEERQNVALTLIVDVSGSMDEEVSRVEEVRTTRLELVKYALNKLVDSLKQGDIVNLVTFSTEAKILLENIQYSQIPDVFIPAVDNLETIGTTNLNDGIEKGYDIALDIFDSSKMNRLVLITDAYANTGEIDSTIISQNTRINEMEGIYFSGIGVGGNFNEEFLNELTEAGKGSYFTIITKTDAKRAFQDRFIAQLLVSARHVRFRLDFPEDMTHTTTASEESSTQEQDVQPTNFSYNTSQYFYEVFSSDSEINETEHFTLTVYYKDPISNEEKTELIPKTLSEIMGLQENNIRDAEIIFLFNQLLGEKMQWDEINNIIETYYSDYSSEILNEYKGLMEKYIDLAGVVGSGLNIKHLEHLAH